MPTSLVDYLEYKVKPLLVAFIFITSKDPK